MVRQVIIGLAAEGSTDERFLTGVIQRSFEEIACECQGDVMVLPVQHIPKQRGPFVSVIESYARTAEAGGIMVLCIHADADAPSDSQVFHNKINPSFASVIENKEEPLCRNLVAVVPVQMTEAWMLADTALLKQEIGSLAEDTALGIDKPPEQDSDPKQTISEAIRIEQQSKTRRRRRDIAIGDIYGTMGWKLPLAALRRLHSYGKFLEGIRDAYRRLNYLR